MALWVCAGESGCGTKYAVGLFKCPRCHNTQFFEDGDPMAKITRHGGASDKTLPATESAAAAEPDPTPAAAADQTEAPTAFATGGLVASPEALREHARNLVEPDFSGSLAKTEADAAQEEGGEPSSPGNSSSPSTEKPPTTSGQSEQPRPKRARTTGRRSKQDQTAGSSAPSTAGGQTAPTSAADNTGK
jgi:hypothetical protein